MDELRAEVPVHRRARPRCLAGPRPRAVARVDPYGDLTSRGVVGHTEPHDTGNDNRNAVVLDPAGTLVELVAKRG